MYVSVGVHPFFFCVFGLIFFHKIIDVFADLMFYKIVCLSVCRRVCQCLWEKTEKNRT